MKIFEPKTWNKTMTLKNKIIVYSVLVLSINLFVIGLISYRISTSTIYESITETNESIVKQTMENIDFVLKGIERETINAFEEVDFNYYLKQAEKNGKRDVVDREIAQIVNRFISVVEEVDSVYIVGQNGQVLSNSFYAGNDILERTKLTGLLEKSDGRFVWIYTVIQTESISKRMTGICKAIFNASGEYNGFVLVLLQEGMLESFYPEVNSKKMMLVDENNAIISSNDKHMIQLQLTPKDQVEPGSNEIKSVGGNSHLVSSIESGYTHWMLYIATPYTNILYEMVTERTWQVMLALLCFFGFVVLIVFFADRLIGPLTQLNHTIDSMNKSNGKLQIVRNEPPRKPFHLLKKLTFKSRLAIVLMISILMPIMVLVFFSYNFTKNVVENKTVEETALNVEQIRKRMESYLTNLDRSIYYFYYNADLIRLMENRQDKNLITVSSDKQMIDKAVENVLNQKRDFLYIDIYSMDMIQLYVSKKRNNQYSYLLPKDENLDRKPWLDTYKDYYNDYLITFVRKLVDMNERHLLGNVFFTVREADIEDKYSGTLSDGNETLFINQQGIIMSSENKNRIGQKLETSYLSHISGDFHEGKIVGSQDGDILLSYYNVGNTGWKLINISSLRYLKDSMQKILFYDLFVLLISILAIGIFVVRYAVRISRPIDALTRSVVSFAGNLFEYEKEIVKGDEVEQLKINFYKMISQIDTLINEVYEIRIKKNEAELKMKEAEMATLQAQINPHFLYNTLEIIRWKSMFLLNGENEVSDIVATLSDYFRLSLSQGRKMITVEEEVEHVSSYMKIMNYRYRDKIDYQCTVSEEALICLVPKITLQPVVENALYHGIKLKEGGRKIHIDVYTHEEELVLEIFDDGVGMGADKLEKLRKNIGSIDYEKIDYGKGGYGLKNIKQRIEMSYGEGYGVDIESVPGEYTKVCIRLPVHKQVQ